MTAAQIGKNANGVLAQKELLVLLLMIKVYPDVMKYSLCDAGFRSIKLQRFLMSCWSIELYDEGS